MADLVFICFTGLCFSMFIILTTGAVWIILEYIQSVLDYIKQSNKLEDEKLEAVKNKLVDTILNYKNNNNVAELLTNMDELHKRVIECGSPLSTNECFRRLQDAVDTRPFTSTKYGPLVYSDKALGTREFTDPVSTLLLRDSYPEIVRVTTDGAPYAQPIFTVPMNQLLSDFADQVKHHELYMLRRYFKLF